MTPILRYSIRNITATVTSIERTNSKIPQNVLTSRFLATQTAKSSPPPTPSKGAGFFQRLSSFIAGAGLTALGTQYFIQREIMEGNKVMLDKQKAIEKRLSDLEKQK